MEAVTQRLATTELNPAAQLFQAAGLTSPASVTNDPDAQRIRDLRAAIHSDDDMSESDEEELAHMEYNGRLSVQHHAARTAQALSEADALNLEQRQLIHARAKTSTARQTKIIKRHRLKKEAALSQREAVGKKAVGYKLALESAGLLDPAGYQCIKRIFTEGSKIHRNWLTELGKGLAKRAEYETTINTTEQKIQEAQIKAQSELDAAAAIGNSSDSVSAEQEVAGFSEHGVAGFDCTDPDAQL